ncbi:hypothetical protein FA13DRAFT_1731170 [Coprinellus micaceus]|uniref:Glycan binding protein Y3-like domain-containing protein n=1 Tax=Coprinellus micaceus TaxID=71717 RepID=A0A4Y7TFD2_COPMI|nr:hypothetical protein FA13DRAFT_1731170 [Coprinellus micaceus]
MVSFKFLSFVSASLALVGSASGQAPGVSCYYSSGRQYDCTRFIDRFCDHATDSSYAPYDSMTRCFTDGIGGKCDLTVWLRNPTASGQVPSNVNCKTALRTVMQSCPSGGTGQFVGAPFQFTIDPNGGQCSGGVPNGSRVESAAREATIARVVTAAISDHAASLL